MEWETDKRLGAFFGIAIIVALLLFDVGVFLYVRARPVNFVTFLGGLAIVLTLPFVGGVIYSLMGLRGSGYTLDRNQLTIDWGATRHVIPTRLIEDAIPGENVSQRVRFRGTRWPGMWVGHGEVPDIGLTLFYTTAAADRQVYVITDLAAYAISPIDREGFLLALEARRAMGPTQDVLQGSVRPAFFDWPLWSDRLARGLVLGTGLLCVALFAYVCVKYPGLPARIPLHFTASGVMDRAGTPADVFILPGIGLLALLVNVAIGVPLYFRERVAAHVVWGGAALVQGLVWVAAVTLLA